MKISKRWIVVLGLAALIAGLVSLSAAAAQDAGSWVLLSEIPVEQHAFVAGFISESSGITAGYAGATHTTADGGQTWTKASNTSLCRYALDIVNDHLAWTAGNGGHVRRSTDGGQTWEAVKNVGFTGISQYISFLDDQNGWVGSAKLLWATADGGQTWQKVELPEDVVNLVAAVALRSPTEGYLLSYKSELFTTTDGGVTWASTPIDLGQDRKLSVMSYPAMRFYTDGSGLMAMQLKDASVIVLRTADNGATWTEESVPVEVETGAKLQLSQDGMWLTITKSEGSKARLFVVEYQES